MVFYRGPAVIGDKTMNQVAQIKKSARGQPEPSGWLINSLLDIGLDSFQLGVVFLIGICICMAAFLAFQVSTIFYIHQKTLIKIKVHKMTADYSIRKRFLSVHFFLYYQFTMLVLLFIIAMGVWNDSISSYLDFSFPHQL